MTNKELYTDLCKKYNMPLFMQAWWLNGVCAGHQWDVLLSKDENGDVRAAMPYQMDKHWWKKLIQMPNLTPYNGVWIRPDLADSISITEAIAADFDKQMRDMKIAYYLQRYSIHSKFPDVFLNMGYKRIDRCTYMLDDVHDLNKVLDGFSRNKRKKLEKNTLTYKVDTIGPEDFYRFHTECNAEKNKELWYSREMFLVQYEHSQERKQSHLICVRSAEGDPLAAAFLVWDKDTLYQLLNCYVHETKDNGAREMLTFEVIKYARELGKKVDFVCHRSYLRHYGAERKNFFAIKRSRSAIVSIHQVANWFRNFKYGKFKEQ